MRKIKQTRILAGLFLALALAARGSAQSSEDQSPRERGGRPLKTQAGILIDLEILTRAEERAEALRAKMFDIQMQEIGLQARIDELDYRLRPENIQRALAFVGSVRPMDELRADLRESLEKEKARVNTRLELLVSGRERLEAAIGRADAEVERLRQLLTSQ